MWQNSSWIFFYTKYMTLFVSRWTATARVSAIVLLSSPFVEWWLPSPLQNWMHVEVVEFVEVIEVIEVIGGSRKRLNSIGGLCNYERERETNVVVESWWCSNEGGTRAWVTHQDHQGIMSLLLFHENMARQSPRRQRQREPGIDTNKSKESKDRTKDLNTGGVISRWFTAAAASAINGIRKK